MNTMWSDFCQKPETLFESRKLKFDDENSCAIVAALRLPESPGILEVGCGPGALCLALCRWYPGTQYTGLDRDSTFLAFARKKAMEKGLPACFVEGDARSLPFPDESFDAAVSHTVIEHVETKAFFAEQFRVLKRGGVCAVMSQRTNLAVNPESWNNPEPEEKAIQDKTESFFQESFQKYSICKYPLTERQLPQEMEAAGFRQVSTHDIAFSRTPDSADCTKERALAIIECNRTVALDSIRLAEALAPGLLSEKELKRWRELVNERFDRRVVQYKNKEKLWDTEAGIMMIARGIKA